MTYFIVSERKEKYEIQVSYPTDLLGCLKRYQTLDREHFMVVTLDGGHNVIGVNLVTIGILNRTLIHPREVFRVALRDNAASIILVHNHPSGNLEPSPEDIAITKGLIEASEIMKIKILDHMIIGKGDYYSFLENNKI